jgi:hypothetical protein
LPREAAKVSKPTDLKVSQPILPRKERGDALKKFAGQSVGTGGGDIPGEIWRHGDYRLQMDTD